jgi:hypothetical protein
MYVLSSSDNFIPFSAGVKSQAGQGAKHSARSSDIFLSVSKTLSDISHDSAVSFKQWSDVECQKFLSGGLLIEHVIFNLNISELIATVNLLVLQTE